MFEDLVGNPIIQDPKPAEPDNMKKIRECLLNIAPDFVEFIERFGWVDIGYGNLVIYGWIEDLAGFFEKNMGERPIVDAWLFGDNYSGDFHAIDKKTGEVVFLSAGYSELDEIRYPSFEKFIRGFIEKG